MINGKTVLNGDNIVSIVTAIKDMLISYFDNKRQIEVAKLKNQATMRQIEDAKTCQIQQKDNEHG